MLAELSLSDQAAAPVGFLAATCTVIPEICSTLPQSSGRRAEMLHPKVKIPLPLPAKLCQQWPACSRASAMVGFLQLLAPHHGSMRWDLPLCQEPSLEKRRHRLPQGGKRKIPKERKKEAAGSTGEAAQLPQLPQLPRPGRDARGAPQSHAASGRGGCLILKRAAFGLTVERCKAAAPAAWSVTDCVYKSFLSWVS